MTREPFSPEVLAAKRDLCLVIFGILELAWGFAPGAAPLEKLRLAASVHEVLAGPHERYHYGANLLLEAYPDAHPLREYAARIASTLRKGAARIADLEARGAA